jgi:Predicted Zn-dependent protease
MDLILYLGAIVIVLIAQGMINATYNKYCNIPTLNGLTGAEVAAKMLQDNGITNVRIIEKSGGAMSDHFNPRTNTVALSSDSYHSSTITAVSIAAHEVGHAIQYATNYNMLAIRSGIVPLANVASQLSALVILAGLFIPRLSGTLFMIAAIMLGVVLVFQILTLPVEFDASKRAMENLENSGYLTATEIPQAKSVLRAAAFTYIAAMLASLFQVIRVVLMSNRRR